MPKQNFSEEATAISKKGKHEARMLIESGGLASNKKIFGREQYPARWQCLELLREHNANARVIAHSEKVTEVALHIARMLSRRGEKIDLRLVEAAALLHDIGRGCSDVRTHAEAGYKLLAPRWPRLAEVVRNHMLDYIQPPHSLPAWEDKVVFYADKRVLEDKVVSLEERFAYLMEHYGAKGDELKKLITAAKPLTETLEREIFNKIGTDVSLSELKGRLNAEK